MESILNQKLNTRIRDKKRKLTICLDNEKDVSLCNWAKSQNIINHYGMPNRSAAVEKLIDILTMEIANEKNTSMDGRGSKFENSGKEFMGKST